MCGIFGEFRITAKAQEQHLYYQALQKIAYRGPDHQAIVHYQHCTLAHARLSLIDLDQRAHQPLISLDKRYTIVFNGTIYNYREITKTLQKLGHQFVTSGDTEAILLGYKEWGSAICEKLDGIFAFAIYDEVNQQLFLARDRFGVKPLYIYKNSQLIRFASNIDALLSFPDISITFNQPALHYQFSFHGAVPAPHTIVKEITKLPQATYSFFSRTQDEVSYQYWSLISCRAKTMISVQEMQDQTKQLLLSAVRKQINANEVPVAILLSGGLDSSLLAALMTKCSDQPVCTFSIGFEDHPSEEGNEFRYSNLVADHISSTHKVFLIPTIDLMKTLPSVIASMSEPMFAQDAVGFYLLAQEVKKEFNIVLSGQGADEVFAGYHWYQQFHANPQFSTFDLAYLDRSHENLLSLLNISPTTPDYSRQLAQRELSKPFADTFLDQALRFDITKLLVDDPVKRVDSMTMAHALEARVPFLDQFLVEFVATLPPEVKLQNQGKGILKKIAEQYLPREVIYRNKGYFPVPPLKYLQGETLTLVTDTLTSQNCKHRNLFNQKTIERLLTDPNNLGRTPIAGNTLWHATLFELWLQQKLPNCRLD
ncbi:MAG: N-acetylglutaminylglutamine amidotransferase [Methylacidiphilales bacterium]|nr:N-acetylglutaminylglutamine amidotransferase [Candidatus Methylacidiphilales bacterium]